jgi:Crp-like helix-turn-helix domain
LDRQSSYVSISIAIPLFGFINVIDLLLIFILFYNFATLYHVISLSSLIYLEVAGMTLSAAHSIVAARIRLAKVLLDNANDNIPRKHQLSQSDMAELGNSNWEMVNASLKSLQQEGAIRLDRHRIIINKKLLREAAESSDNKIL